jgi:hypothetical protein
MHSETKKRGFTPAWVEGVAYRKISIGGCGSREGARWGGRRRVVELGQSSQYQFTATIKIDPVYRGSTSFFMPGKKKDKVLFDQPSSNSTGRSFAKETVHSEVQTLKGTI